MDLKNPQFEKI